MYKNKFAWLRSYSNSDITGFVNGLKPDVEKEGASIHSLNLDILGKNLRVESINALQDVNSVVFLLGDLKDVSSILSLSSLGISFKSKDIFIVFEENLESIVSEAAGDRGFKSPQTAIELARVIKENALIPQEGTDLEDLGKSSEENIENKAETLKSVGADANKDAPMKKEGKVADGEKKETPVDFKFPQSRFSGS